MVVYLDSKYGSRLFVFDFFHDPVGPSPEDTDALKVVGLDGERLFTDCDRRPGVQVAGNCGSTSAKKQDLF